MHERERSWTESLEEWTGLGEDGCLCLATGLTVSISEVGWHLLRSLIVIEPLADQEKKIYIYIYTYTYKVIAWSVYLFIFKILKIIIKRTNKSTIRNKNLFNVDNQI